MSITFQNNIMESFKNLCLKQSLINDTEESQLIKGLGLGSLDEIAYFVDKFCVAYTKMGKQVIYLKPEQAKALKELVPDKFRR